MVFCYHSRKEYGDHLPAKTHRTTKKEPPSKLLSKKKFSGFIGFSAVFMAFFLLFLIPRDVAAFSITNFFKNLFWSSGTDAQDSNVEGNSLPKPFPFLSPIAASDPKAGQINSELQIIDSTSLAAAVGPLGNVAEASESPSYAITTYTVHRGDTLTLIAKTFNVSVSTITWANNIPRGSGIREGDVLVILPVSGVKHTVAKGDTIASIAKKYGGDPDDIIDFNDLTVGEPLEVNSVVIVPDGELSEPSPKQAPVKSGGQYARAGGPDLGGYYLKPVAKAIRTQGIHGYNGVDLAALRGSPVYASADGVVITARQSGWNGGYGKYIAIVHPNGTQTLYAHLDSVMVTPGVTVSRGQQIGGVGSTGKSTGPHVHFEIRGAKNPF